MKLFNVIDTTYDRFDTNVNNYLTKAFNSLGIEYKYSQLYNILYTGIKGIMQNAMFYIEDALTEQNIFRASRKTSVYSLAKISGYEASYGATATGSIMIQSLNTGVVDSISSKIYIYNKASVYNRNNGLKYTLQLPTNYYIIDLKKPLIKHEFKLIQGYFETKSFVATGIIFEIFSINITDFFDKSYITVKVNGEEWTQQSCLYDMSPKGKEYIVNIGYENSFDIMFGDNTHGKRLSNGDQIEISFLKHSGVSGNINKINESFYITSGCYDAYGNIIDVNQFVNIFNSNYITGGTNSDTIKFIRETIGMNSRSLVLASEDNFKLFFKRFSFIGYVNCWSENNSMIVTATCLSNIVNKISSPIDYYNLSKKDMLLSNVEKQMIITTLDNSKKSFAGITLNFKDPIIRRFAFICYIKTDNVYSKENIKNNIQIELAKYFTNNLTNTKFIAKSDIIKYCLDNIEDIKSIDIDIISELAEQCYKNNYYNKYELIYSNGSYKYITKKIMYEESTIPGLDYYGNISLDSNLEFPVLQGGFNYYPDKTINKNNNNSIKTKPIEIVFI